jgi:hypothetical protein
LPATPLNGNGPLLSKGDILIAISVFGAIIGVLLGLRSTVLALIPALLLLTAIAAGYGLVTHQSGMVFLTGLLAALVVPQLGFALAMYSKSRAIKPTSALLMIPSSQRFGASSHGGLPTTSV